MIQEYIRAFSLIFLAEMGDKTQLLALAFATQYRLKSVMVGIGIGSFLNHSLAIALGIYISGFIDAGVIQIIAGFAFVGFSLWTLRVEEDEEEDSDSKDRFGPVLTVAVAFFIGELGDKTQLTAVALAIESIDPILTVAGTVSGMLATGLIGIIVGRYIGGRIPELTVKLIASTIFMGFGLVKLYKSVPGIYMTTVNITLFILVVSAAVVMTSYPMIMMKRKGQESALKARSRELHEYYEKMNMNMDSICLGTEVCEGCRGLECPVGCIKSMIGCRLGYGIDFEFEQLRKEFEVSGKTFDNNIVLESIKLTEDAMEIERSDQDIMELEAVLELLKKLLDK